MTTRSWIRNLFARSATRPTRKAVLRARPALEALEGRVVPATFAVTNTLDDGSAGSLRWAVAQANATAGADTINVAVSGTIFLTGGQLGLTDAAATTIAGPGAGLLSVSGNNASRVFNILAGASAALSGLTITGGNSTQGGGLFNGGTLTLTGITVSGNTAPGGFWGGGGLFNNINATATLTNCTVSGNTAPGESMGGGGINNFGAMTLTDSTISGNSTSSGGGGLANRYNATATLTNCTVSGNTAGGGGGVTSDGGNPGGVGLSLTMTNCTISNNTATQSGGGFHAVRGGTITLTNCTVSGNSASEGGGVAVTFGGIQATLTNCTVSNNTATNGGGVVFGAGLGDGGQLVLTNCTVSGNSATGFGGGIANPSYGQTTLANTIVAGNTAPTSLDVQGGVSSLGNNLIGKTDGSTGWVASDLTGTVASPLNPLLGALANNGGPTQTMALLTGSPAINAGNNALIPVGVTTDQRGFARIVGGTVDIGAFESGRRRLVATAASQGTINIGSNGSIVLHLAIAAGQLVGTDTVASLFDGATFTIAIQKADGSVTYGTLTSTARVESDGTITISMRMNDALRADLYEAYVNGRAVNFNMTAISNDGNYFIDEDTMSRLLNNGGLRYVP